MNCAYFAIYAPKQLRIEKSRRSYGLRDFWFFQDREGKPV
jgi:hypothetical protein